MLSILLFFLFPAGVTTLLSVPFFLWLKARVKQRLLTYLVAGLVITLLVGLAVLSLFIKLTDNPIDGAASFVLALGCYGLILGFIGWLLRGRLSSASGG